MQKARLEGSGFGKQRPLDRGEHGPFIASSEQGQAQQLLWPALQSPPRGARWDMLHAATEVGGLRADQALGAAWSCAGTVSFRRSVGTEQRGSSQASSASVRCKAPTPAGDSAEQGGLRRHGAWAQLGCPPLSTVALKGVLPFDQRPLLPIHSRFRNGASSLSGPPAARCNARAGQRSARTAPAHPRSAPHGVHRAGMRPGRAETAAARCSIWASACRGKCSSSSASRGSPAALMPRTRR